MAELDGETLKRRVGEASMTGMPGLKFAIIAALEDRDRLRAGSQQALKAIAACVVGWDYPDVPPMPEWAKRLESVVPLLQAALGIPVTLDHETSWHSTSSHNSKTQP